MCVTEGEGETERCFARSVECDTANPNEFYVVDVVRPAGLFPTTCRSPRSFVLDKVVSQLGKGVGGIRGSPNMYV